MTTQHTPDQITKLQARIADLEAQLYALGAGEVGQSIKPQIQADTAQEPVAWRVRPFDYGIGYEGVDALTTRKEQCEIWARKGWKVEPLYAAPQQQVQQKPVAWIEVKPNPFDPSCRGAASVQDHALPPGEHKLYTAPQPTENLRCKSTQKRLATLWGYEKAHQPLTDEQIMELRQWHGEVASIYFDKLAFARAVEAAHGITGGQP